MGLLAVIVIKTLESVNNGNYKQVSYRKQIFFQLTSQNVEQSPLMGKLHPTQRRYRATIHNTSASSSLKLTSAWPILAS